jgi:hypothetical protein
VLRVLLGENCSTKTDLYAPIAFLQALLSKLARNRSDGEQRAEVDERSVQQPLGEAHSASAAATIHFANVEVNPSCEVLEWHSLKGIT